MSQTLLPTTVVGSFPQPAWLVDHAALQEHGVPRVRARDIWRVSPELLVAAQDDATLLTIATLERAGIDIITDGEIRRESYSNHFIVGLEGIDCEHPVNTIRPGGKVVPVPRIVGPIRRRRAVAARDVAFLRANTTRRVKVTLPGPFTMAQQSADEFYRDRGAAIFAFADAVNEEARDLVAAGADVIQIDEPWLRNDPQAAEKYAVAALDRAFAGITADRAVHLCFGYGVLLAGRHEKPRSYAFLEQLADAALDQISIEAAQPNLDLNVLAALRGKSIMLGVLDLSVNRIESVDDIASRIRAGLQHVAPDRLMPAPDCGMKYLSREVATGKLAALARGTALVRRELTGAAISVAERSSLAE